MTNQGNQKRFPVVSFVELMYNRGMETYFLPLEYDGLGASDFRSNFVNTLRILSYFMDDN